MKQLWLALLGAAAMLFTGCRSSDPLYFEELTEAENRSLVNGARELALQSKAMPDYLRGMFTELEPNYVRVTYDGDKHGKAAIRWEIYEPSAGKRLTQKDVNPYWIMVYASGDLTDPMWKISHAAPDKFDPKGKDKMGAAPAGQKMPDADMPGYAAPPPRPKRNRR